MCGHKLIYNVADITRFVKDQLYQYEHKQKIKDTVVIPPGFTFEEYVVWQWYVFSIDHMLTIRTRLARGWCWPDEEIVRFALRTTRPEMDKLYRILRIPQQLLMRDKEPTLRLENRERDLMLQYPTKAEAK